MHWLSRIHPPRALASALLAAALLLQVTPGLAHRATANTVTITMWDSNTYHDLSSHLDTIIMAFEKTHPGIQIKLVHNQTLDKDLAAIASGNGPDVVWLWDGSAPVGSWAASGVIQPLDRFISSSHYNIRNLVPASVQQVTWNGHTWGLPLVADSFWLWYNINDFKAAGLDSTRPPTTLQEVMSDAVKLTKRTGSGRILRLGYLPPYYSAATGFSYVNGNDVNPYSGVFGASLLNSSGSKVTPDSAANLAAWREIGQEFRTYDTLYGHSTVLRFMSGLGAAFTPQDAFLQDRVSMKIDGDWVPQNVRDYKPGWKYGVDYAVAPIPYPAGYAKFADHQPIATYPLVMSSKTRYPEQAWEFIRWLQDPAQTASIAAYLYNLPQYQAALNDPQLTSLPGFNQLLPLLKKRVTLVSDPASPVTNQYYTILNSYTSAILGESTTPQAAMLKVRQRVQPMLDQAQAKTH